VDGVSIALQVVAALTLLAAVTSWLEGKGPGAGQV
jgi:hypothetical protein